MPRSSTLTVLAVLALVTLLSACGVPVDERSRDLAEELPEALQENQPPPSTDPPQSRTVTLFLVRRTADTLILEGVEREVDAADALDSALRAVLSPALPEESAIGLVTLFGDGSELQGTALDGDLLDVRLDSLLGFPAEPNSAEFQVAVAELVCTASVSFPAIRSVTISVRQESGDFQPITVRVPGGEPATQPEPVRCDQFAEFFPEGSAPTSTSSSTP